MKVYVHFTHDLGRLEQEIVRVTSVRTRHFYSLPYAFNLRSRDSFSGHAFVDDHLVYSPPRQDVSPYPTLAKQ